MDGTYRSTRGPIWAVHTDLSICPTIPCVGTKVRCTGLFRHTEFILIPYGTRYRAKKEERRGEEERIPRAILARALSRASLAIFLTRREKDRGDRKDEASPRCLVLVREDEALPRASLPRSRIPPVPSGTDRNEKHWSENQY
ncbi:hypothetical protein GW17_00039302 [Ensete ventricosum]|nr:hypothetical protein GW17_00039302 [Ensete ventricosum]